jgi:predicted RNA-binding protein YlxR (DUF448 family)
MKKIPMRMCIVTKEKLPKKELIRIVKLNDEIKIDLTGKLNGKGCYLKKDKDVIITAQKKKILNSVFETEVSDEIYNELLNINN